MDDCMVTTMDNPWNPFTHYHEWLSYDMEKGYNTGEWIHILTRTSNDLLPEEVDEQIDAGIARLLEIDPYGIHVKLYSYDADTLIPILNKAYSESISTT